MSLEIPIKPNSLDHNNFIFSVSVNTNRTRVTFQVIIKAKTGEIFSDSNASISIVTHAEKNGGELRKIEPLKPEVRIALKKAKQVWNASFSVPRDLLEKPGVCFVFTEFSHATIDGKLVTMPSADFYTIRLREFLK